MQDLYRVRYAAEHFGSLKGLQLVPWAVAAGLNPWLQEPPGWDLGIVLLLAAGAVLVSRAAGLYYRNHYGVQRPLPAGTRQIALVVAAVVTFYTLNWLEFRYRLPVSTVGLAIAALFLSTFRSAPGMRWYYGVAALAFTAAALAPLVGIASPVLLFGQYSRVGWTMFGAALAVCGVLDHLQLRRLFPLPPRELADT